MSTNSPDNPEQYTCRQNRELSWMRFNRRVLEEAYDISNPPLERLKFIAIFSNNFDEFFRVRVGSLYDISVISPAETDRNSGMTAAEQLEMIYSAVPALISMKERIYTSVSNVLTQHGICDLSYNELDADEKKYADDYFNVEILPLISPMIIGNFHPVPHLANKCLHAAALLHDGYGHTSIGIIPFPDALTAYLRLPGSGIRYIRTENVILNAAPTLFGHYKVLETCILSVTRNADLNFDSEKFEDSEEDFRSMMMNMIKVRERLSIVRMEIGQPISDSFLTALADMVHLEKYKIFQDRCPLVMKYVYSLDNLLSSRQIQDLLYKSYISRWPADIRNNSSIISQIRQKDRLLYYPYDSVDPFLQLLEEAAGRPDVISIKITIYRLASSSKIAHILCMAAENGKEVIVLMELRARFDEANNITWSKLLEDAGCKVIYGNEEFKCHSKICLITLHDKRKFSYITQIGTGNYNEKTNKIYADLSLMTASGDIGSDASAFFRNMLIDQLDGNYRRLLVAPTGIRSALCSLIDEQTALGSEGYICIKANSVTEREVTNRLIAASQAGVGINLIIRGICCILPGVSGYTDNIHVTSIVGRFLEHARIYCFGKGDTAKLFISSADLMTRNLNRRVEIACPVYDPDIKKQIFTILSDQLRDNVKARDMDKTGQYVMKGIPDGNAFNSQQHFMDTPFHHASQPAERQNIHCGLTNLFRKYLGKPL